MLTNCGEKAIAMRCYIFIYILLLAGNTCAAEWEILRQDKLDTHFKDIYFVDENIGWAVGIRGVVAHTIDGGLEWIKQDSGVDETYVLDKICFSDGNRGWIIGSMRAFRAGIGAVILHTQDGGTTWERQYESDKEDMADMDFVGAEKGWIAGITLHDGEITGTILHTDDGENWEAQFEMEDVQLSGIDFINQNEGWAVGYNTDGGNWLLFHTIDSGDSWQEQARFDRYRLSDIYFIDSQTGWAIGNTIIYTNDGGVTWSPRLNGIEDARDGILPNWILEDICFSDEKSGWIVSSRGGRLIRTEDGGDSWQWVDIGRDIRYSGLSAVYFTDSDQGWIAGDYANILRTTDGNSWELQTKAGGDLVAVDFADPENGWAVGFWNALHTSDGGSVWSRQAEDIEGIITGVDFKDPDHGWIHTRIELFHTEDGGSTFSGATPSLVGHQEIYSIQLLDDFSGWAVGRDIAFFKVQEDEEWQDKYPDGRMDLWSVDFVSEQEGWLVGSMGLGGICLSTENGGRNWEATQVSSAGALLDVDFVNQDKGWAVGREVGIGTSTGIIVSTRDGGKKWEVQYRSKWALNAVCFVSADEGYAVGMEGIILHTKDGGENWELLTSDNEYSGLFDICYDGTSSLYAVGEWGIILRLADPDISSGHAVEAENKLVVTFSSLKSKLHQNYPNPFNPETWIPFSLAKSGNVKIRIYNSVGKVIRTLDMGYKSPGTYISKEKSAYWDGKNEEGEEATSDVYFYAIDAGGDICLRKMTLIR